MTPSVRALEKTKNKYAQPSDTRQDQFPGKLPVPGSMLADADNSSSEQRLHAAPKAE